KSTFSQSNTSQRKRSASKNLLMFYIRNNGNLKDLNQITYHFIISLSYS
ncbi:hypothetical protein M153_2200056594, partial [Pseudoloma neurophilia]